MKKRLLIVTVAFSLYIISYILFFLFVNESHARWSYYAYYSWVYFKFALPSTLIFLMAVTYALDIKHNKNPNSLKCILAFAIWVLSVAYTILNIYYWCRMDDAPMGLIPDINLFTIGIFSIIIFYALLLSIQGIKKINTINKTKDS
ncbi:MAG: hypothetical protein ACMUJM_20655 [bacterium]